MATTTASSTSATTNNVVSSQSTISAVSSGVGGETSTVAPKKEVKDTRRRVKVYVLNEKRTWEDRGTGHVTCTLVDRLQGLALIVRSESDNSIALESKILTDTAYQKQQETLIVWSEGDNCDLALSFQEKAGCEEIWERICQVQGRDPTVEMTQDPGYEAESENDGGSPDNQVTCSSSTTNEPLVLNLPQCELSRLSEINDLISSSFATPLLREALVSALENQGYIKKLLDLFRMCEDLDNKESLFILYRIMMNIFMLNKNALFEILFSEDNLKDVIGIFEYDPNLPSNVNNLENRKHREYLYEKATFREIMPITNQELKSKIHQTYRVQYIQDCILPAPSIFEENLLSTLSSFIFFNKVEIVSMIQEDEKFLKELFDRLTLKSTMSNEHKRDLSAFLKEFCAFSQKLQPQDRDNFFRNLTNRGILKALENLFQTDDDQTRLNAIEILSHVVDYNASLVRDFALQQTRNFPNGKKSTNLLNIVIDQIFHDDKNDPEMAASLQLAGILKILIDPENMMSTSVPKSDKSEFLAFFYKHCISSLVAPLLEAIPPPAHHDDVLKKDDYHTCQILNIVLDLLTFCIEHHSFQMRTYLVNKNLLKLVLFLLKSKHKFLSLSALRLFRRIVQLKDNMYNNHIMREQLFVHIAKCFQRNGPKYNLLNSAMLELFEFIRTEDIHMLVADIVENYFDYFKDVTYVKTFTALKLRHDQYLERQKSMHLIGPNANRANTMATIITTSYDDARPSAPQKSSITAATTALRDARDMDETEEQWFNEVDADEWDDDLPTSVELSSDATNNSGTSAGRNENDSPPNLTSKREKADDDFVFSPLLKSSSPSVSPNSSPFRSTSPTAGIGPKSVATKIVIKSLTSTTASALTSSPSVSTSSSPRSTSPLTSPLSPLTAARKGLVDYDDDSSDEEDGQQNDCKNNQKLDQKTSAPSITPIAKSPTVEQKMSKDSVVVSLPTVEEKLSSIVDQKKRDNEADSVSREHHQSKKQKIDEDIIENLT